jgi:methionyl-tRNA formyltransferase
MHLNLRSILDTIIKNNYNVVGVITAADKPAGRGQKIKYSVKEYALSNNLKLLQPTN